MRRPCVGGGAPPRVATRAARRQARRSPPETDSGCPNYVKRRGRPGRTIGPAGRPAARVRRQAGERNPRPPQAGAERSGWVGWLAQNGRMRGLARGRRPGGPVLARDARHLAKSARRGGGGRRRRASRAAARPAGARALGAAALRTPRVVWPRRVLKSQKGSKRPARGPRTRCPGRGGKCA
ncbi:MAG: hypothetical protein J3K34DRAFT_447375 [Monoraphidium minutum]|nr:MAG: hypothetical protein J3K34DRAFT_447375 [Monoraphidium minutum]